MYGPVWRYQHLKGLTEKQSGVFLTLLPAASDRHWTSYAVVLDQQWQQQWNTCVIDNKVTLLLTAGSQQQSRQSPTGRKGGEMERLPSLNFLSAAGDAADVWPCRRAEMKCETGHSQEDVGEKPEQSSQLFWAHPESQSSKHVWKHQIDRINTYSTVCVFCAWECVFLNIPQISRA